MLTVPCRLFNKKKTRRTHSAPSLPFQQVQVLFHSLFKVLFIFPSRYLFAIGLPRLFSFRWTLPPASSCNPKQLDSLHYKNTPAHLQTKATAASNTYTHPQGWHLLWLFVRRRNWFADWLLLGLCLDGRQTTTPLLPKDFHPELIPLHSPLLRESLLVSFPPLSYMLKSSGSSCLIRGLKRRECLCLRKKKEEKKRKRKEEKERRKGRRKQTKERTHTQLSPLSKQKRLDGLQTTQKRHAWNLQTVNVIQRLGCFLDRVPFFVFFLCFFLLFLSFVFF